MTHLTQEDPFKDYSEAEILKEDLGTLLRKFPSSGRTIPLNQIYFGDVIYEFLRPLQQAAIGALVSAVQNHGDLTQQNPLYVKVPTPYAKHVY